MTPPSDLNIDALAAKLAGLAGAIVSMNFLQGTWPARISMALSGALISYFAAPHVATKTSIPEGLAGFLLGMFGMAIASRAWEWIQTAPIGAIWQAALDWITKRKTEK